MRRSENISYFGFSLMASFIFVVIAYIIYATNYSFKSGSDSEGFGFLESYNFKASDSALENNRD